MRSHQNYYQFSYIVTAKVQCTNKFYSKYDSIACVKSINFKVNTQFWGENDKNPFFLYILFTHAEHTTYRMDEFNLNIQCNTDANIYFLDVILFLCSDNKFFFIRFLPSSISATCKLPLHFAFECKVSSNSDTK